MCIIIAKPSGVDVPLTETLDNCFTSNRDGIGFAYNLPGDHVTISKGFQNVKKLEKMLQHHNITKDHNLVIHFRFATHGKKDQGNCHPFPLTDKYDIMRYLHCTCPVAIAHNGVFSGLPASDKYSDTMKFIGGVLSSQEIINNLESKSVKELIRGYCGMGSKLAFLRPEGLSLIGDFEKEDGVFYSNSQFKSYRANSWMKDKDGKSYCYIHKCDDHCSYCYEHKVHDLCAHTKEQAELWKDDGFITNDDCCKTPILIGDISEQLGKKCVWCQGSEELFYSEDAQGFLCKECDLTINDYHQGKYYE